MVLAQHYPVQIPLPFSSRDASTAQLPSLSRGNYSAQHDNAIYQVLYEVPSLAIPLEAECTSSIPGSC
jgi:hypothetical protein